MDNIDSNSPDFADSDGVPSAPGSAGAEKVREMERDSLFMQGVLHLPGKSQPVTVRVRNLSAGGLMADFTGPVAKDMLVEMELRSVGLVNGHVAWVSESQFGMAFDTPIDPLLVRRPIGVKRDDLFRPMVLDRYKGPKRGV